MKANACFLALATALIAVGMVSVVPTHVAASDPAPGSCCVYGNPYHCNPGGTGLHCDPMQCGTLFSGTCH